MIQEIQKLKTFLRVNPSDFIKNSVTNKKPAGCEGAFNKACRESIKGQCKNLEDIESLGDEAGEEISFSLYCPQFSLRLMAHHITRLKEENQFYPTKTGETVDLAHILRGNGDRTTEARYITSRYNRGKRIFNSAIHRMVNNDQCSPLDPQEKEKENNNKCLPTAKDYGELWATKRPEGYTIKETACTEKVEGKDPFCGGNLDQHRINRCHVWRIAGICGGSKDSSIDSYTKLLCAERREAVKNFGKDTETPQQNTEGAQ